MRTTEGKGREAGGWRLDLVYRAEYEQQVAAVRDNLSEAAFEAAWAEGRAVSREAAVEYALEDVAQA